MKYCVQCGEKPRMTSSTGKALTMCEDCQREYWRQNKEKNKSVKTCPTCGETKPLTEFAKNGKYRRRYCKSCYSGHVHTAKKSNKGVRTCKVCGQTKPDEAFGVYGQKRRKYTCLVCEQASPDSSETAKTSPPKVASPQPSQPDAELLLVDTTTQKYIRCRILSETRKKAVNGEHLRRFYAGQGYTVLEGSEDESGRINALESELQRVTRMYADVTAQLADLQDAAEPFVALYHDLVRGRQDEDILQIRKPDSRAQITITVNMVKRLQKFLKGSNGAVQMPSKTLLH